MKQLGVTTNGAGGLDLIVERDAGNPVRILTGKRSEMFFEQLLALSSTALEHIKGRTVEDAPEDVKLLINQLDNL